MTDLWTVLIGETDWTEEKKSKDLPKGEEREKGSSPRRVTNINLELTWKYTYLLVPQFVSTIFFFKLLLGQYL